jgi:hypothetical protein
MRRNSKSEVRNPKQIGGLLQSVWIDLGRWQRQPRMRLRQGLHPGHRPGLRSSTPSRERPLRRRGLSLALPRPRLAPGQGGRARSRYRRNLSVPVQASLPVAAQACDGWPFCGLAARKPALPSITRYDDGPAKRSKPMQFTANNKRCVSLSASCLARMPYRPQPMGCAAAATASRPRGKRAPHRLPAPWLHAQWRGKVEREEETTAWCPPRSGPPLECISLPHTVAARCLRSRPCSELSSAGLIRRRLPL